ncbi:hypothetical protein LTR95_015348, partial [Oleoguttula sp. CCFEE 5521]
EPPGNSVVSGLPLGAVNPVASESVVRVGELIVRPPLGKDDKPMETIGAVIDGTAMPGVPTDVDGSESEHEGTVVDTVGTAIELIIGDVPVRESVKLLPVGRLNDALGTVTVDSPVFVNPVGRLKDTLGPVILIDGMIGVARPDKEVESTVIDPDGRETVGGVRDGFPTVTLEREMGGLVSATDRLVVGKLNVGTERPVDGTEGEIVGALGVESEMVGTLTDTLGTPVNVPRRLLASGNAVLRTGAELLIGAKIAECEDVLGIANDVTETLRLLSDSVGKVSDGRGKVGNCGREIEGVVRVGKELRDSVGTATDTLGTDSDKLGIWRSAVLTETLGIVTLPRLIDSVGSDSDNERLGKVAGTVMDGIVNDKLSVGRLRLRLVDGTVKDGRVGSVKERLKSVLGRVNVRPVDKLSEGCTGSPVERLRDRSMDVDGSVSVGNPSDVDGNDRLGNVVGTDKVDNPSVAFSNPVAKIVNVKAGSVTVRVGSQVAIPVSRPAPSPTVGAALVPTPAPPSVPN